MKDMTLLAVGGAGCRIMRQIANQVQDNEHLKLLAADTDLNSLQNSGLPPENTLQIGELWRHGRGCGGSVIDGQRAFAHERPQLEETLRTSSLVVVIAGLGGGCGSGGVPVIQSVLHKLKIPVLFLLALPFSMEGHSRLHIAEQTLSDDLRDSSGVVVPLPNDLLFSTLSADTPLATAFELADQELARSVLALTVLLNTGNLLSADFATLEALFRRGGNCAVGFGAVDKSDPEWLKKLVDQVLDAPLLGGSTRLKEADAVVVSLNGPNLALGEAKQVFETLGAFWGEHAQVLSGAGDVAAWGEELQLTVLAVKFTAPEALAAAAEPALPLHHHAAEAESALPRNDVEQPEFAFVNPGMGVGIMERTTPVIVNGENLDIPTFLRRRITIDRGN